MSEARSDNFYDDPGEAATLLAAGDKLLAAMERHNKYCAAGGTCSVTTLGSVSDALKPTLTLTAEYRRRKLNPGFEAGGYVLMGILGKRVPDPIILTARVIEDAAEDLTTLLASVMPRVMGGKPVHQKPPEGDQAQLKTAGALKLALDELRVFLKPDDHSKKDKETGEADDYTGWITAVQAETISGVNRGIISRAADANKIKNNGKTGRGRRLDPGSFSQWTLKRSPGAESTPDPKTLVERAKTERR